MEVVSEEMLRKSICCYFWDENPQYVFMEEPEKKLIQNYHAILLLNNSSGSVYIILFSQVDVALLITMAMFFVIYMPDLKRGSQTTERDGVV